MKNVRKKIIRVLIIALLLQILPECAKKLDFDLTNSAVSDFADDFAFLDDWSNGSETVVEAAQDYGSLFSTDPEIISRINYASSLYGPGSYLTKNGRACTCHSRAMNHIASPASCNCLRYVTLHGNYVDLLGVQCYGYAMYMQMCLFGTTQNKAANKFTFLYGNSSKAMTALEMERFFVNNASLIHPGTHMRCKYGQHSIVIMAVDYKNGKVTIIDCNRVGYCQVSNYETLTWAQLAQRFYNINYLAVYKGYYSLFAGAPDASLISQIQNRLPKPTPTTRPATPTPSPTPADYPIGLYKVIAQPYLNLREDTYTYAKKISTLPTGLEVEIFDFIYNKGGHHWGLIDVEAGTGWSSMGYLELVAEYTPTPTPTRMPADYESGTYRVTAQSLYVREGQSTMTASVGKLPGDTMVDMMIFVMGDGSTKWGYVSIEDKKLQGWVSMDYMEIVPTLTPVPTDTPTPTPSDMPEPTSPPVVTDTPEPTDIPATATPVPTAPLEETEANNKDEGTIKTFVIVILVITGCILLESALFISLKKRRERKWKKRRERLENKRLEEKVKGKFKKK